MASTLAQRERELREGLDYYNKVKTGQIVDESMSLDMAELERSARDMQTKLNILEEAKRVQAGVWEGKIAVENQEEYVQSVIASTTPFAKHTEEGATIDVATAMKAGIPEKDIKGWGISDRDIDIAKTQVAISGIKNLPQMVREGKIGLLKKAQGYGILTGEQVVDIQKEAAAMPRIKQAQAKLAAFIDPETNELDVTGAITKGVPAAVIRNAGYDVRQPDYDKIRTYVTAPPMKKFDILMKEGQIPKGSTFGGSDKDGNIKYIEPEVNQKEKEWLEIRAALIQDKLVKPDAPLSEVKDKWDSLKATQKGQIIQLLPSFRSGYKEGSIFVAELAVPGLYTARHWATMTTGEKVLNISLDVASVLLILYGGKILRAGIKPLTSIGKTERLADKAGKTADKLAKASGAYQDAFATGKVVVGDAGKLSQASTLKNARLLGNVQTAQVAASKADRAFLQQLSKLKSLSPKQLRILEQKSGIKGLARAITDVTKASDDLNAAWRSADKIRFHSEARTFSQVSDNNEHILRLMKVQEKEAALENALVRAESSIKPRYQAKVYSTWVDAIKVQKAKIAKLNQSYNKAVEARNIYPSNKEIQERSAFIKQLLDNENANLTSMNQQYNAGKLPPHLEKPMEKGALDLLAETKLNADDDVFKAIDGWLKRSKELKGKPGDRFWEISPKEGGGIAVKPITKISPVEAKIVPKVIPEAISKLNAKAVPKVVAEPSISAFPGLRPKVKEAIKPTERAISREDVGRMTSAQIAEKYGFEPVIDARGKPIILDVIQAKEFRKVTPTELIQVNELVKEGLKADTAVSIRENIVNQNQVAPEPLTQLQVEVIRQVVTNTKVPTKPVTKPPIGIKPPKTPLRFFPPIGKESDIEKRKRIISAGGAIAWAQGELQDKKVWHTIMQPYRPSDHIVVIGVAPQGAKLYAGPREAYKSVTLLSGSGPSKPATFEGGAVDPTIYTTSDGKVKIAFTKDTSVTKKRYAKRFSKIRQPMIRESELAEDIVETRIGGKTRRHIKLW